MKKIHKNINLLKWFNFCSDFRIYSAIAVLYFAQVTGSFTLALAVFSIGKIASSVFELPTGVLSDLVGRRKTVILGQWSSLFAIICYALGGSFVFLAIGAVLEGLAYSFFSGNNSALLYDSLKEEGQEQHYGEYEGKTSSMFQIALGISALIGGITLGFKSFQFLFWLSVIPQVIGLVLAFKMVEPRIHFDKIKTNIFNHLKEAIKKFKENAKLRTLSLANIIGYGLGEFVHQFAPAFFATLWPSWAISFARVLSHLFAAIGFHFAGRMVKRFGELKILLFGNSANFIIGTAIVAYPTIATPLISSLTSLHFGVGSVAKDSLLQKEFSDAQRATMGSLNALAGSAFFAIFAILLGFWADKVGPMYALLTAKILSISTLFLYHKLFKKENNEKHS